MKERPILFSAPMVRAILSGAKTQTRRLVGLDTLHRSTTPGYDLTWRGQAPIRSIAQQRRHAHGCWQDVSNERLIQLCPYGQVGDRLWVRETWGPCAGGVVYGADDHAASVACPDGGRWRPSIYMPRWASRITLEVTDVRVERLQEISDADARAEGMDWSAPIFLPGDDDGSEDREDPREVGYPSASASFARQNFTRLWDALNAKRAPWSSNPWVWAVSFKRVTP